MKQVILKKGIVLTEEVARPVVSDGSILIRTVVSCISAGTELASIQTSDKPLIKRAMEQPEKVRKVFNWLKEDGIINTYKHVQNELNVGTTLGYSLSGIVVATGNNVSGFHIGDRVAAAGGTANHAEYVEVPVNLVTSIPDNVSHIHASTVALGAIAMQSIRRADLRLGEYAVVIGCGLLGLLVVQMLAQSGVRVAATDLDPDKLDLAVDLGAELAVNPRTEDPVRSVQQWSDGHGADVVIFAAATDSNDPLSQAFNMCRRKGRVILLGVSGMQIDRKDIYQKELDFMVSTSYGPGRYDLSYEEKGNDYPYAYVRWTEKRNLTEFIRLIATGRISFDRFTCNIFPVEKVSDAFSAVKNAGKGAAITFLQYAEEADTRESIIIPPKITISSKNDYITIGLVGAGNFAKNMHIPNILKLNKKFRIHAVMDTNGYNAKLAAKSAGEAYSTTNFDDLLGDTNIQLIMICTRHDSHAPMALKALEAGKHVFVEKPLATNLADLDAIKDFYTSGSENQPLLMVGFNRRFSPYAQEIKKHTDQRINPLFIHYRMNAGFVPLDHWVHENGGRIVGEACHILDLITFLVSDSIKHIHVENIDPGTDHFSRADNKSIILKYNDGSVAAIDYFALGSKKFSKEYMEVHFDEKTIIMDDYISLQSFGLKTKDIRTSHSQKGHLEELNHLYDSIRYEEKNWPISLEELIQTTEASLLISNS